MDPLEAAFANLWLKTDADAKSCLVFLLDGDVVAGCVANAAASAAPLFSVSRAFRRSGSTTRPTPYRSVPVPADGYLSVPPFK